MATLLNNKKARFNYEILDTLEAGIKLKGWEVKSLREKKGSLAESYIRFQTKENAFFLVSAHIPPYQAENKGIGEKDPYRPRKLLLHKKEIEKLQQELKQKGLTLIPLDIHTQGRYLKMDIALARGKKKADKRKTLRDRAVKRDIARIMKQSVR